VLLCLTAAAGDQSHSIKRRHLHINMRQRDALLVKHARADRPSDVVIYVISGDHRPQGNCSAKTWVSDALDFGFHVVYYSQNATHISRNGSVITTRYVRDFGSLSGARDNRDVWVPFAANILEDLLSLKPAAKFFMRMDDDSYLHCQNLWRSLLALPLESRSDWMIGDCGEDEHHSVWCSGGAGIVLSRPLAEKLIVQLRAGYQSADVCALLGRNDDDTMGLCAHALYARIVSHHGYHWWPPARLSDVGEVPQWTWWPRLSRLLGKAVQLNGCPVQKLGPFAVVKDWITYHHLSCNQQVALSEALREQRDHQATHRGAKENPKPLCASDVGGIQWDWPTAKTRCQMASKLSQHMLCHTM